MSGRRSIVLKFGGSVLRDERSLQLAVYEIYRWRREGYGVIAVVSALAGTTDELLAKAHELCGPGDEHAIAGLVAGGELASASLLVALLERFGVPAWAATPGHIELEAEGPPLDAEPCELDARPLRAALDRDEVVVVPGFVGIDREGRTVTFGRGGSDLSALFLADRLGATRCRLIKDVDALYERDPHAQASLGNGVPRRYAQAGWDDALATDGTILQHKALRFARRRQIEFEVAGFNASTATRIGPWPRVWAVAPPAREPMRVVLAGLGTVNGGTYALLSALPELFEVLAVGVRSACKPRSVDIPRELVRVGLPDAVLAGADVLVEAIGDVEHAHALMDRALRAGVDVVSANKSVLASRGAELEACARSSGRALLYSASVGGGVPILERIDAASARGVLGLRAVLNGTTNVVLDALRGGATYAQALQRAVTGGFAEGRAERDLSGADAADKLCLIARRLGRHDGSSDALPREALTPEGHSSRSLAGVRQVATLPFHGHGAPTVKLERLAPHDPLIDVHAEQNGVVLELADGTTEILRGKGAGRWPTALSILADLLSLVRRRADLAAIPVGHDAQVAANGCERREAVPREPESTPKTSASTDGRAASIPLEPPGDCPREEELPRVPPGLVASLLQDLDASNSAIVTRTAATRSPQ